VRPRHNPRTPKFARRHLIAHDRAETGAVVQKSASRIESIRQSRTCEALARANSVQLGRRNLLYPYRNRFARRNDDRPQRRVWSDDDTDGNAFSAGQRLEGRGLIGAYLQQPIKRFAPCVWLIRRWSATFGNVSPSNDWRTDRLTDQREIVVRRRSCDRIDLDGSPATRG
jgi:hypothetical protein